MEILQHFEIEEATCKVYSLKESETAAFLDNLPEEFRLCYITDEELDDIVKKNGESKVDCLRNYILPDEGSIMSGDFGEMLSYFFVVDKYRNEGLIIKGPRKWRWKPARNKPTPCSDAVLFHTRNKDKPSLADKMITIESKMKSLRSNKSPIQDAINGAKNDRNSRAVKSLDWLHEKYGRCGMKQEQETLQRFRKPSKFGTYERIFKAMAIIDRELLSDELKKDIELEDGIKVLVITTKDLKTIYQESYKNIISSVE